MTAPVVVVTRSLPGAEATAARLRARGAKPLLAPMLTARPVEADLSGLAGAQALALTSANAVRALADFNWSAAPPVFAVGEATAEAARAAGAKDVTAAEGDARGLARLMTDRLDPAAGPVAFLRGRRVAGDLAGDLASAGFEVRAAVVYETVSAEALPVDVAARIASGGVDAVLLHSSRGATAFATAAKASLPPGALERLIAAAISPAVADAVADAGFASVVAAPEPNENSLVDTLFSALAPRF